MEIDMLLIKGQKIVAIEDYNQGSERVVFSLENGTKIVFEHEQDCCESVMLSELDNNIEVGHRIANIELRYEKPDNNDYYESATWTFITITTDKCHETMRWVGESNGYYSEVPAIYQSIPTS